VQKQKKSTTNPIKVLSNLEAYMLRAMAKKLVLMLPSRNKIAKWDLYIIIDAIGCNIYR